MDQELLPSHGLMKNSKNCFLIILPRQLNLLASMAGRVNILLLSKTPMKPTTWSSVPFAVVIPGLCWESHRIGTNLIHIGNELSREPRKVLQEFGVELQDTQKVKVWDSTAEIRYLVVPMQPEESKGLSEDELVPWVTRNSMIGTGLPTEPK